MVRSINLVTGKFQIKSLNGIPLNPKSYGIFQKIDAIYKKNLSIHPPHVIDSIKKSVNPICQKKKLQALKEVVSNFHWLARKAPWNQGGSKK